MERSASPRMSLWTIFGESSVSRVAFAILRNRVPGFFALAETGECEDGKEDCNEYNRTSTRFRVRHTFIPFTLLLIESLGNHIFIIPRPKKKSKRKMPEMQRKSLASPPTSCPEPAGQGERMRLFLGAQHIISAFVQNASPRKKRKAGVPGKKW